MKNKILSILKWGVLLGLALALLEFVKSYTRSLNFTAYDKAFSLLALLIAIFTLYFAIKEIRDKFSEKLISYPKAFGYGLLTVLIAFFVLFGYLFIHFSYIDKEGLEKINAQNVQRYSQTVGKDTVTTTEVKLFLNQVDTIIEGNKQILLSDREFSDHQIITLDSSIDLVLDFYDMYVANHKMVDSSQFLLENFDLFAKNNLVSAFEHFNNQNCFNEELIEPLTVIFLNSAAELPTISPLQKRIDNAKDEIPQHTNILASSFIFSLSLLLYGGFCALFVALYLYRKKLPTNQPENSTPDETPDSPSDFNNDSAEK